MKNDAAPCVERELNTRDRIRIRKFDKDFGSGSPRKAQSIVREQAARREEHQEQEEARCDAPSQESGFVWYVALHGLGVSDWFEPCIARTDFSGHACQW